MVQINYDFIYELPLLGVVSEGGGGSLRERRESTLARACGLADYSMELVLVVKWSFYGYHICLKIFINSVGSFFLYYKGGRQAYGLPDGKRIP